MESGSSSRSAATEELFSGFVFRGNYQNAVFVRRRGVLYPEMLATYRDPPENVEPRLWLLTNECEIAPVASATFLVAADGWRPFTARLMYKTYSVNGVRLPRAGFVVQGGSVCNTILVLGFETEEAAAEWRTALTNAIMGAHCLVGRGSEDEGPRELPEIRTNERISPFALNNEPRELPLPETDPDPAAGRDWYAIKELDGLTVYYQEDETGGAYMVSTQIHAHPKRVLDALTTGSFLLCCGDVSLVRRDGDLEILHLKLNPVGLGHWLLPPRELLIERVWTEYASGMLGVLFKSCEERVSDTPKDQKPWWSWFTTPTQAYIPAAGFTILPVDRSLEGHGVDSLISLVLKIDFGGVCAAQHPLKAVMDGLGICQAWIDRLLQTVTDLKTRLEDEPKLRSASSLLSCSSLRRRSSRLHTESFADDGRGAIPQRQNSLAFANGVLNTKFWSAPGSAGFKIRGANYLRDRAKIPADEPRFRLDWVYILRLKSPTHNISRHLPAVRSGRDDFTFVMQVMIPGPPYLAMVIGWVDTERASQSSEVSPERDPFETVFTKFIKAEDSEKDTMFKLIPKVVQGNMFVRAAVGHTPVIMGKKLKQSYHTGPSYFELDIDVASSRTASTVIGIVQGATRSLSVDLAVLIQGDHDDELPESLIGTVRLDHVDLETAVPLETIMRED